MYKIVQRCEAIFCTDEEKNACVAGTTEEFLDEVWTEKSEQIGLFYKYSWYKLLLLILFQFFLSKNFFAFHDNYLPPAEKKFKLLLIPEKQNYYLGENILVHYALINEGKKTLTVNLGGDYRGAWRAHRFKVTVLNANKDTLPDPFPAELDFGGLSSDFTIQPKDTFFYTLQLNYYARIIKGGKYHLYIKHDLGWPQKEQPIASAAINISEPDSAKAGKLLNEMLNMQKDPSWSYGKKRNQFADFNCIRAGVYYTALAKLADKKNTDAIDGLGSLYTKEASWKLLSLLSDEDTTLDFYTANILTQRLPLSANEKLYLNDFTERKLKADSSWTIAYSNQAENIAIKFLKSDKREMLRMGANIIRPVGSRETIFPLMKALTREIKSAPPENTSLVNTFYTLKECADELLSKYAFDPLPANTEGQDVLFLLKLLRQKNFRPDGWKAACAKMLSSEYPLLVQTALECIPDAQQPDFFPALKKILMQADVATKTQACYFVKNANTPVFDSLLLHIVRTATEENLLNAARGNFEGRALMYDALKLMSSRLTDSTCAVLIIEQLRMLLIEEGSGSFGWRYTTEEAKKIQQAWQTFLAANEAVLKNGNPLSVKNKIIRRELFPASYEWVLNDGGKWP